MKKPKKYNDEDTKREGSPIETPFKHNDTRRKNYEAPIIEEEVVEVEVEEDV